MSGKNWFSHKFVELTYSLFIKQNELTPLLINLEKTQILEILKD